MCIIRQSIGANYRTALLPTHVSGSMYASRNDGPQVTGALMLALGKQSQNLEIIPACQNLSSLGSSSLQVNPIESSAIFFPLSIYEFLQGYIMLHLKNLGEIK